MKVSTLRAVDRWIGVPLCVVLTWHRRIFRRRAAAGVVRRILFVKLAEQGSTVLAAEAITRAIRRVGRENVFFLVFAENRFILDAMGLIPAANVLTADVQTFGAALRTLLAVVPRLRTLRIDAAIGLEFYARSSAILSYLSGASRRVGLHAHTGEGSYCGDLYTHRLVYNPYLHTSDLFTVMVEALDRPASSFPAFDLTAAALHGGPPAWEPGDADLAAVRRLLRDASGTDAVPPLVLLNANCGDLLPLRRWEPARYVELARRLLAARPELVVVFTGAPSEADVARRLVADVQAGPAAPVHRCFSLAGETTLPQLLALYSLAQVLVTNDSGPAHFAALTPIDVVTLFGPETPALFAARTPRNHALWAGTVCSPCVSAFNNRLSACRNNVCMQRLTVGQVFEVTLAVYDRRREG